MFGDRQKAGLAAVEGARNRAALRKALRKGLAGNVPAFDWVFRSADSCPYVFSRAIPVYYAFHERGRCRIRAECV